MKLLNIKQMNNLLKRTIENRKPFSMVRLGDGEWNIIKYPKITPKRLCLARIGRWFNVDDLRNKDIMSLRNQITRACKDADLLGVPSVRERLYPKWKKFVKLCNDYKILQLNQKYFHFYHVKAINFKEILKDVKELNCITCRDLNDKLIKTFNIDRINLFPVPREHWIYNKKARKKKEGWDYQKHYPTVFHRIMTALKNMDLQGKIFLVGAGGLGKIYCMQIKKYGGIALDIGAMFDGWCGLYTRPFLKNSKKYKL